MQKQALLILGMHRAGTSALTRTYSLLGAQLPGNLIPSSATDNPKGYWESLDTCKMHDAMLSEHLLTYLDWHVSPSSLQTAEQHAGVVATLKAYIQKEFATASCIVLKDPRACLFATEWIQAFTEQGFAVSVTFPLRHPFEVAASLCSRGQGTMSENVLLWLRYVLDAEVQSRNIPRFFVPFTDLLADWRSVVAKASEWCGFEYPCSPDSVAPEIDAFLAPSLKHHAQEAATYAHGQLAVQVFDAMFEYAQWQKQQNVLPDFANTARTQAFYAQIDTFRALFEGICPELKALMEEFKGLLVQQVGQVEKGPLAHAYTQIHTLQAENQTMQSILGQMEVAYTQANALLEEKSVQLAISEKTVQRLTYILEKLQQTS